MRIDPKHPTRATLVVKGLPKLHMRCSRPFPPSEDLKSFKITYDGRVVTANLQYAFCPTPLSKTGKWVGLDMGIEDRIATSDGGVFPRVASDDTAKKRKQRRVARAKRGSRSRRKKVAVLRNHARRRRIAQRNADHRITSDLVRRYDVMVIEGLNILGMTRSAKGTIEDPGRNVKQKTGLNREILANAWGRLGVMLGYKAAWAGKQLIVVPPEYTSQTCSGCGVTDPAHRKGKRYRCLSCGHEMDADTNAAINILRRGREQLAGGP